VRGLGKVGSGQPVADAMQRYWTQFAITLVALRVG